MMVLKLGNFSDNLDTQFAIKLLMLHSVILHIHWKIAFRNKKLSKLQKEVKMLTVLITFKAIQHFCH